MTIPTNLAAKIPAACDLLARKEAVILEMARAAGFNVAKLREALPSRTKFIERLSQRRRRRAK